MAPHGRASNPLRVVTQRINATSPDQLPHISSHLINSLLDCEQILGAPPDKLQKGSEDAALLQKFKTQISNLLQSKSAGGRWVAVLLIKASVEIGRIPLIQGSGSWVRSLVGILSKPDPAPTRKAVIITLTRIFMLTHGEASVVREITTPTLPSFVTGCLNCVLTGPQSAKVVKIQSPLVEPVLQAFIKLLPSHPSIFRPSIAQINVLLSRFVAPTTNDKGSETDTTLIPATKLVGLAQELHPLLSQCTPKNNAPEQWLKKLTVTISHAHRTADNLFRALVEDNTGTRHVSRRSAIRSFKEKAGDEVQDELSLAPWSGIFAGSQRLVRVLELLEAYTVTQSQQTLNLPVSDIWELLERLLSVFGPSSWKQADATDYTRYNPEADREEREDLWLILPDVHEAALNCLSSLIARLGSASQSSCLLFLERVVWTFYHDLRHVQVRINSYRVVTQIVDRIGPSLTKNNIVSIKSMISTACVDAKTSVGLEDSPSDQLAQAAMALLGSLVSNVRGQSWMLPLRAAIDQTAIFTQNKDTMVASVLNPTISKARSTTSILPFLARAHPGSVETEALIRPRLPVIRVETQVNGTGMEVDEELEAAQTSITQPEATVGFFQSRDLGLNLQHQPLSTQPTTEVLALHTAEPGIPVLQSPKRSRESDGVEMSVESPIDVFPEPKKQRKADSIPETNMHAQDLPRELEDGIEGNGTHSGLSSRREAIVLVPRASEAMIAGSTNVVEEDEDDSGSDVSFDINMDHLASDEDEDE